MKEIYMRGNVTRAVTGLCMTEGTLRHRVSEACNYLLRSDYAGTKAERTFNAVIGIVEKVDHGDWSKVTDAEIRTIAEQIIEMAMNLEAWIPSLSKE